MIYDISLMDKYFKISYPIKSFKGIIEASEERIDEINQSNSLLLEDLMKKYETNNPNDALAHEIMEREKSLIISDEAIKYIENLNTTYANQIIQFFYSDPMLYYFTIDDEECSHIPVYEVFCNKIELVKRDHRYVPMIISENENYSLLSIVNIKIISTAANIQNILQKAQNLSQDSIELISVANKVFELLNDKEWVQNIFVEAIQKAEDSFTCCEISRDIYKTINNNNLILESFQKAYALKQNSDDFAEILNYAIDIEFENELIKDWKEEFKKKCSSTNHYIALSKIDSKNKKYALSKALLSAEDTYECLDILEELKK